jgi:hypothetical protein
MSERTPGYYWVTWTKLADEEVALRRPGPLVAQWDGDVWWLIRSDTYRFDRELVVIASIAEPVTAEFPRPILAYARAVQA